MDYKKDGLKFTKHPASGKEALYVQSNKINEIVSYIKYHNIKHIILNSEWGYKLKNIKFVDEISDFITGIDIEVDISDFSPLSSLHNLEYLSISSGEVKQRIDFSNFPTLLECNIPWNDHIVGITNCKKMKKLTIREWTEADLLPIKDLKLLESLSLYNSNSLKNLNGIEHFFCLKDILVFKCKNLISIENIRFISNTLIDFSIIDSKNIHDYEAIGELVKLKNLTITNCGSSPNARFLESLRLLEYGSININFIDGDVSNILELPIIFKNYNHFSHKNIHKLKMNSEGEYVLV